MNPSNTSSLERAGSEDSGEDSSVSLSKMAKVVKKVLGGKAPGVDESHPEMLKALDIIGLPWLTCLFIVVWRWGTLPVE